jgi:hypothetical protein
MLSILLRQGLNLCLLTPRNLLRSGELVFLPLGVHVPSSFVTHLNDGEWKKSIDFYKTVCAINVSEDIQRGLIAIFKSYIIL